jgi:membrane protein implicated in regulation of membrane protease activity
MNEIALFLESIDPWWFIFIPILILLIDWALIGSEVCLIIALAFFILAGAKFLNISGTTLAWLIPVSLTVSFFFQRSLLKPLFSSKLPSDIQNVIGETGVVEEIIQKNESKEFFDESYLNQRKADQENNVSTFRLSLKKGKSYVISNTKGLKDGQAAKIINNDNGIVTVKVLK